MIIYRSYPSFWLSCIILSLIDFFQISIFPNNLLSSVNITISLYICLAGLRTQGYIKLAKSRWTIGVLLGVSISTIMSYIYYSQSPILGMLASREYSAFLLIPLLLSNRIRSKSIEATLNFLSVLFLLTYIINWLAYPTLVFGLSSDLVDGKLLGLFQGSALLIGSYVLAVSRFVNKADLSSISWMLGVVFFLWWVESWTAFVACVVVLCLSISRKIGRGRLKLFRIYILSGALLVLVFSGFFDMLIQRINDVVELGIVNDIRYQSILFYTELILADIGSLLFGYGMPSLSSRYGELMLSYWDMRKWVEDVGIIGLIYYHGIFTLLFFVYALRNYLSSSTLLLHYLGVYFAITALTTYALYQVDFIIIQSLLVVISVKRNQCEI